MPRDAARAVTPASGLLRSAPPLNMDDNAVVAVIQGLSPRDFDTQREAGVLFGTGEKSFEKTPRPPAVISAMGQKQMKSLGVAGAVPCSKRRQSRDVGNLVGQKASNPDY
jgi:hypothetical protein